MKQQVFEHISKDRGLNQNHFIMASNDVRPIGKYDVTDNGITATPSAALKCSI